VPCQRGDWPTHKLKCREITRIEGEAVAELGYPVGFEATSHRLLGVRWDEPEIDAQQIYGDQSLFKPWREGCVAETANFIRESRGDLVGKEGGLIQLLSKIGESRWVAASKMGTSQAEKFGILRTVPLKDENTTLTHLTSPRYREFNQKLRVQFANLFPQFQRGEKSVVRETEFSRVTVQKFDREEFERMLAKAQTPCYGQKAADKANEAIELLNSLGGLCDLVKAFEFPGLKMPSHPDMGPITVGPLQFLVGTVEVNVDGVWKKMTRHATWLNAPDRGPIKQDAIEYFKKFGFATLIHSPKKDVAFHLKALEPLTQKLIGHKYDSSEEFQRDLRLWDHRLYHAMPYYRGSASGIEILREAICLVQGQEVPVRKDIDALCI